MTRTTRPGADPLSLRMENSKTEFRKQSFACRVVTGWNKLSKEKKIPKHHRSSQVVSQDSQSHWWKSNERASPLVNWKANHERV